MTRFAAMTLRLHPAKHKTQKKEIEGMTSGIPFRETWEGFETVLKDSEGTDEGSEPGIGAATAAQAPQESCASLQSCKHQSAQHHTA